MSESIRFFPSEDSRIYVAGHRGLVGSAIVRSLDRSGCTSILTRHRDVLDLEDGARVDEFFRSERPTHVFLAAAKVGGILANSSFPADFIRANVAIQLNVIDAARRHGVRRLIFLGSSCIYPKFAEQPIREDALLGGPLEPTNEAYAIAKIAGIKQCQSYNKQYGTEFICLMPTNLYGPFDNFDLATSHVLPALIRKFHEAKLASSPSVTIWGSGTPRREFLHVDDLADACVHMAFHPNAMDNDLYNIGCGDDIAIADLAAMVAKVVGWKGELIFDHSKPDGTPRKLLDVSRIARMGWGAGIPLEQGIQSTYHWYLNNQLGSRA